MFTAPAAVGSLLGTLVNRAVSAQVLILSFVPIMVIASAATWQRAAATSNEETGACPAARPARTVLAGVGVGILG
jgi:uncharacterized membrane protein YfcA